MVHHQGAWHLLYAYSSVKMLAEDGTGFGVFAERRVLAATSSAELSLSFGRWSFLSSVVVESYLQCFSTRLGRGRVANVPFFGSSLFQVGRLKLSLPQTR